MQLLHTKLFTGEGSGQDIAIAAHKIVSVRKHNSFGRSCKLELNYSECETVEGYDGDRVIWYAKELTLHEPYEVVVKKIEKIKGSS